jgi:hypothetical protein
VFSSSVFLLAIPGKNIEYFCAVQFFLDGILMVPVADSRAIPCGFFRGVLFFIETP